MFMGIGYSQLEFMISKLICSRISLSCKDMSWKRIKGIPWAESNKWDENGKFETPIIRAYLSLFYLN